MAPPNTWHARHGSLGPAAAKKAEKSDPACSSPQPFGVTHLIHLLSGLNPSTSTIKIALASYGGGRRGEINIIQYIKNLSCRVAPHTAQDGWRQGELTDADAETLVVAFFFFSSSLPGAVRLLCGSCEHVQWAGDCGARRDQARGGLALGPGGLRHLARVV